MGGELKSVVEKDCFAVKVSTYTSTEVLLNFTWNAGETIEREKKGNMNYSACVNWPAEQKS